MPKGKILPPIGERRGFGADVYFGVRDAAVMIEGQTFRGNDPAPQERRQQQQQGGGLRLPRPAPPCGSLLTAPA